MVEFILTPTNIDFIAEIQRDPFTNRWVLPVLTFPVVPSPYYSYEDPLNHDRQYQNHVVNHIYTRLSEKWLFKYPMYKSLIKYFVVEKHKDEVNVRPIDNVDNASSDNVKKEDHKYVLKYIDKVFVTKRFVRKVLKEYVGTTRVKWYDLYQNTSTLKDLFAHKLKKLIVSTIYELDS